MTIDERRLIGDERGAVLVMGVFMSACIAGMLWYLAGIGDAIIYRQRLQEASDAAAFSAAVLHARGMNLIVLLNLLMACILGVRVAMRAIQAGLVVVATVAAIFPPTAPASGPLLTAARGLESAIRASRNTINGSIRALAKAQDGVRMIAPAAALAGSYQVGSKYAPLVSHSAAGSPFALRGLPIDKGTTDRLCKEAGEAVVGILLWMAPAEIPGFLRERAKALFGKAVEEGGVFFCELGKGSPPDFSEDVTSATNEQCDREGGELEAQASQAEREYQARCQALGACGGGDAESRLSPQTRTELVNARAARDSARSAASTFDVDRCREQKRTKADAVAKNEGAPNTGAPNAGAAKPSQAELNAMRPATIAAEYRNGANLAQILAVSKGSDALLAVAPTGVKAGAWNRGAAIDIPASAYFSFAQAEFFYDCSGRWQDKDCNGADRDGAEAMWHFRWRARLRRYNAPFGSSGAGLDMLSEGLAHALFVGQAATLDPQVAVAGDNAILLKDLGNAFTGELIIH